MCGVLPLRAQMTGRLTLGYREAVAVTGTPWLEAGERVRGHEFHYTQVDPADDATPADDAGPAAANAMGAAWTLSARGRERREGFAHGGVQASYLHVHWAAHRQLAWRFARAAGAARAAQPAERAAATTTAAA
jgi:cobyrinic acid a,c-diamide synthase